MSLYDAKATLRGPNLFHAHDEALLFKCPLDNSLPEFLDFKLFEKKIALEASDSLLIHSIGSEMIKLRFGTHGVLPIGHPNPFYVS